MVNVCVNESYVLRSIMEIGVNQELFVDYNHDVICYFSVEDQKLHRKKYFMKRKEMQRMSKEV
jgi:hypothetical protein